VPFISAPPVKKGKQGAKALSKTGAARAPHSASVRGHGRKSVTVMADQALIDVGAGTSDKLPHVIRQSFKDSQYSPSTGMVEMELQIMPE
jgi:hypothetical protein